MNRPHQWIAAMIVCVGMLAASGAHATDWPQWRGPNRDSKVVGFTPPAMWPRQLTRRWKITVGLGVASPALVSDKLYVFTRQRGDEVISCLDAATGRPRWQDKYAAQEVNGPADQYAGPRSSPAIAEGKICTLGVSGILSCLDAATGVVVWRKDSGIWPDFYTSTSPLIVEGKCTVHLGGRGKRAVVAYDLASGAEKWKWSGDGPSYGSPVLMTVDGTKLLVTLTESSLIGVRVADGKLLLRVPFHAGTYNMCTPIVYGRTVICAGRAFAIEKEGEGFTARQLWKTDPPTSSTPQC